MISASRPTLCPPQAPRRAPPLTLLHHLLYVLVARGEGVKEPATTHEEPLPIYILRDRQAAETLRPQPYSVHGRPVSLHLGLEPVGGEHGYGNEQEPEGVGAYSPPPRRRASFPWRHHDFNVQEPNCSLCTHV